ncbi:hypothetical protein TELCIR_15142 [Teladorsagia circumcincta]|uniref:Uncharacterized protein n=1 Tax=Teladorsagia circumcincta TaxID=45464 RepID=A0A2G9TZ12_TELCI|nr:hypothetical protein TELCIR_15142 [Teladorsagia circumcincta]
MRIPIGLMLTRTAVTKGRLKEESKLSLFGTDGIKFVPRPYGTTYRPRHPLPTVKSGSGAVMVRSKGVGPSHLIEGKMNFKIY